MKSLFLGSAHAGFTFATRKSSLVTTSVDRERRHPIRHAFRGARRSQRISIGRMIQRPPTGRRNGEDSIALHMRHRPVPWSCRHAERVGEPQEATPSPANGMFPELRRSPWALLAGV